MILTEQTFLLYAAKHYDNPHCHSLTEFEEDLKRFQYLRKLLSRYKSLGDLRERLILNHLIIIYNCFGANATNMLFMKLEGFHEQLSPFVSYLNYMPMKIEYENKTLLSSRIEQDKLIIAKLREV